MKVHYCTTSGGDCVVFVNSDGLTADVDAWRLRDEPTFPEFLANRFDLSEDDLASVCLAWLHSRFDGTHEFDNWDWFTCDDPDGFPHEAEEEFFADDSIDIIATIESDGEWF